jgi:hypothetical protein
MNPSTLIVVCGYTGDAGQIDALLPMFEHHQRPILILSPEDSKIEKVGHHLCQWAGKRAYIGQDSLDRQHEHMALALEKPFEWYLFNDADSFCLTPEIPADYYRYKDTVWSNEVADFRIPGETWTDANGSVTWPDNYHAGFPLIAMQPPYFMSRWALEKMVRFGNGIKACPITPFIDWYMVQCVVAAGLRHFPFRDRFGKLEGASCETITENGLLTMERCIREGARFIHSVKSKESLDRLLLSKP